MQGPGTYVESHVPACVGKKVKHRSWIKLTTVSCVVDDVELSHCICCCCCFRSFLSFYLFYNFPIRFYIFFQSICFNFFLLWQYFRGSAPPWRVARGRALLRGRKEGVELPRKSLSV